jgi:hypothetical protein
MSEPPTLLVARTNPRASKTPKAEENPARLTDMKVEENPARLN